MGRQRHKRRKQTHEESKEPKEPAASESSVAVTVEPASTSSFLDAAFDIPAANEMYQQIKNQFEFNQNNQQEQQAEEEDEEIDEERPGNGSSSEAHSSKRKREKTSLLELKETTRFPELVEWFDVDAKDPKFLVKMKSMHGVVQVPPSWQNKNEHFSRHYRQQPYQVPQYIKDTGITELRDVHQPETDASLRQKTRERVQPKMGKMDLDYRKLYNAFFKFQTRPPLSKVGEVFTESRDITKNFLQFRPTVISDRLRDALGLKPDSVAPWTPLMVKNGPSPSYPNLKLTENTKIKPLRRAPIKINYDNIWPGVGSEDQEDQDLESTAIEPEPLAPESPEPASVPVTASVSEPEQPAESEQTDLMTYVSSPEPVAEPAPGPDTTTKKELYKELTETQGEAGFLGSSKRYNV